METVAAMGVFATTNFQSVSQLSLPFGEKHKELEKAKWELAETQQRYEQQIGQLKQEHKDKIEKWKKKAKEAKQQLQNADIVNQQQAEQIALVNQELKDVHLASKGCSFVDVRPEDFKQVLCKIHKEFRQAVIDLYSCFNEMQGMYDMLESYFPFIKIMEKIIII